MNARPRRKWKSEKWKEVNKTKEIEKNKVIAAGDRMDER